MSKKFSLVKTGHQHTLEAFQESDEDEPEVKSSSKANKGSAWITEKEYQAPPAMGLTEKHYSLQTDMLFGWKPKMVQGAPIPLSFPSLLIEGLLHHFKNKNYQKVPKLIYLGFRPRDTFEMHQKFSSENNYNFHFTGPGLDKYNKMKQTYPKLERPFIGMNPDTEVDSLIFDSQFECGNLDAVVRTGINEYDLYMRVDSNTKGHTSWFFFSIRNMQKNSTVTIKIMNFGKGQSLYSRGMRPYIYSEKLHQYHQKDWEQSGEDIQYRSTEIRYDDRVFEESNKRQFCKLMFTYKFPYDNDTVYMALCVPYSYTRLLKQIQIYQTQAESEDKSNYITEASLCNTLGGVKVPILTITDPDVSEIPMKNRQYIVITGRVHPGETNGSWMMEGFLEKLCSDDAEAHYLRKRFIFKIVPMMNPDGVIMGNYRTGFCGNDLNRQFSKPHSLIHPTVKALKSYVEEILYKENGKIFAFIDFHGHSMKKNTFFYGAEFPVYDERYYRVKLLPKIISQKTDMFRFYSCIFRVHNSKMGTSRAIFSMDYGITNCYTLESSYASYFSGNRETIDFCAELFKKMGNIIGESLYDLDKLLSDETTNKKKIKQMILQRTGRKNSTKPKPEERRSSFKEKSQSCEPQRKPSRIKATPKKQEESKEYPKISDGSKLNNLIEEIANERKDFVDKHESDDFSEGDSDAESQDDDLDPEELYQMHNDIVEQIKSFGNEHIEKEEIKKLRRATSLRKTTPNKSQTKPEKKSALLFSESVSPVKKAKIQNILQHPLTTKNNQNSLDLYSGRNLSESSKENNIADDLPRFNMFTKITQPIELSVILTEPKKDPLEDYNFKPTINIATTTNTSASQDQGVKFKINQVTAIERSGNGINLRPTNNYVDKYLLEKSKVGNYNKEQIFLNMKEKASTTQRIPFPVIRDPSTHMGNSQNRNEKKPVKAQSVTRRLSELVKKKLLTEFPGDLSELDEACSDQNSISQYYIQHFLQGSDNKNKSMMHDLSPTDISIEKNNTSCIIPAKESKKLPILYRRHNKRTTLRTKILEELERKVPNQPLIVNKK